MISVTAGPSRQAKLGVSSQTSYTVDRTDPYSEAGEQMTNL
jgi:hypothetical protein